jgi:hypothetical protein
MAYTTAQLDGIVATLEAGLGKAYAEVIHEGKHLVYRNTKDIMAAIGYFKSLYEQASDAPPRRPKPRTFLLFGGQR